MGKWKHLTEEDYNKIKALLNAGVSPTLTKQITKRGAGTVSTVKNTESYKEYREVINSQYMKKLDKKKASTVQGVGTDTIEVPSIIADTVEQIDKVDVTYSVTSVELLNALNHIAGSLDRLVEAWESTPSKKGWLK